MPGRNAATCTTLGVGVGADGVKGRYPAGVGGGASGGAALPAAAAATADGAAPAAAVAAAAAAAAAAARRLEAAAAAAAVAAAVAGRRRHRVPRPTRHRRLCGLRWRWGLAARQGLVALMAK